MEFVTDKAPPCHYSIKVLRDLAPLVLVVTRILGMDKSAVRFR